MNSRAATLLTTLGAAVALLSTVGEKSAHYIWNASASVPIGLYRLQSTGNLSVTELVTIQLPEPTAKSLADGGYLPRGVPMLKRVLALHGQTVCRNHLAITVDKIEVGGPASATAGDGRCRSSIDLFASPE
jgi:type IV secretory pathway protease TraF